MQWTSQVLASFRAGLGPQANRREQQVYGGQIRLPRAVIVLTSRRGFPFEQTGVRGSIVIRSRRPRNSSTGASRPLPADGEWQESGSVLS
jgi:hypothetical protein